MLSQFTVKNYKSIRDEMTFDMQATAISEHTDRLIKASNNELLLPVSAIYGPNGGGKSNVLQALHTLELKILRPLYATESDMNSRLRMKNLEIVPFAFDEESKNSPTEFEIFFQTTKAEYRYILHVLREKIVYESLSMRKVETNRTTDIFEREDGKISMGDGFSKLKVSEDISDTLPLLSYLGITYRKNEVVGDCISWFEDGIEFLNYGSPIQELQLAIANSTDIKELILNMIREMDLDIEDFRVEKREAGDIQVFTKHNVDGNTSAGPNRAVVTDDYIFLIHSKKTYSFRKEDGSLVAETGGNHAEMDLSGSTNMLGTNNAGELYVINTEYADGNEYHLMKYSPELELISETISDNIVTDDAEQWIPLPDSVRGFEDMYIKGDKLYIEYGEKETVILSFGTGIYEAGDTEGFVWGDQMEEKTQDFENGVYRSGKYYYFEDAANELLPNNQLLNETNNYNNNPNYKNKLHVSF